MDVSNLSNFHSPERNQDADPLGPEGIYGFGHCGRCGESFQEDDEQAELGPDYADIDGNVYPTLIIHAACMEEGDELA